MEQRPNQKVDLLAWKGGAALYRAVRAHESSHTDEFQKYYRQALDLFSEAGKTNPNHPGVAAVTGGSFVIMADRLPEEYRAAAWTRAYDSYQVLWKMQASAVERLPLHLKGELLGGLAQSAQRTGRAEELAQYLDKIVAVLGNTPYERIAKQWKENPKAAASASITCLSCHEDGRLAARIAAINK
jgi:hypothetical protein